MIRAGRTMQAGDPTKTASSTVDGNDVDASARAVEDALAQVLLRPVQSEKTPPCSAGCATGADVRGWINVIAQRGKLGLSIEEAYARAFGMVTAVNPFPATLGRICPHPCESGCNREGKDGAVAINALERFLGDWALERGVGLARLDEHSHPEWIGVIGAGPAGLSFAYQMARRGYRVTVYERESRPGGMLQYGIPQYRLPEAVLDAEIRRLVDVGVELVLDTIVGRDVSVGDLRERHAALFLGIGATRGLGLGVPGEEGPGVWTGVDYLGACNRGEAVMLGRAVVVVGGGNTAMDAARTARRSGAQVTVLYRRTAAEMPAIASEVDDAVAEGIAFEYLAAPVAIERIDGVVTGVVARRMELGATDASGRRRCTAIDGTEFRIPADAVISAVSQSPDWSDLDDIGPDGVRDATSIGQADSRVVAGGDVLGPGIAGFAIAQGRRAAETLHARLRGIAAEGPAAGPARVAPKVKPDFYAPKARTALPSRSVEARLAEPDLEVTQTLGERQFLGEIERCFSCGLCFGCEHCFTFCNPGGFTRLDEVAPGAYFALSLDRCEACRKCVEVCPCGFLSIAPDAVGAQGAAT
jgi:NADPH-dependent glutamate synthase beta subunit-like oxidoreductase/ferredoxin